MGALMDHKYADSITDVARRCYLFYPVEVSINRAVQDLCAKPYPGHAHGCPNYGTKAGCPPTAPFFPDWYETTGGLAVMEIDFAEYRAMRQRQHPTWTDRQLRCPLYWQGHFRKIFKDWARQNAPPGYAPVFTPEARGVDVTETCSKVGIQLEWPPTSKVYMVAVYAKRKMPSIVAFVDALQHDKALAARGL